MSNIPSIKVLGPGLVVVAALMLGGCGSMTTYGTGTTAAAQTFEDIGGMLSLGDKNKGAEPIDYSPRSAIVEPPGTAALPTPGGTNTVALASNWPTDPDAERKRQEALIAELHETGETPRFTLPTSAEPVGGGYAPRKRQEDMSLREKYLSGRGDVAAQKKLFADAKMARGGSFDDDGKPIRRYLTEPPVVYLDPDPESPVIITEKPKKKNRFNWPDIWPF